MKIVMINSVCGIRSTGRICTDIAVRLEQQGHEVKIAYGRGDVPQQMKRFAVKIGSDMGVRLHALKSRAFDASGFGSATATKRFIGWLKDYNPDIIHLHNIHGYYIHIGLLFEYLKHCKKRIIWTLHDCWAFTGHSAYCHAVKCEQWKTGCRRCPNTHGYPKSIIDRSAQNWKTKHALFCGVPGLTLITPSQWLAEETKQSFLSEYPVRVIHNGIDTSVFKPTEGNFRRQYCLDNKKILLGVTADWDTWKGFDDFIKLSRMIGNDCRIVLVGVTAGQKAALPKNIIGIERTSDTQELAQIYSASDIFLNLTYDDNYPTVNLEAIACGTPVITYRTGGSPEAAGNGGRVVEQGDLDAVAAEISKINKSDFSTAENRDNCDKQHMIDAYLKLYAEK